MSDALQTLQPLVSVVIPIKNRSELFAQTAQSLIEQTYPRWETVIVDDGSSLSDLNRIAEIAAQDKRMRLIHNPGPRSGACAARNAGFAASQGEYVVFLDSDDALAATCLARRVQVMEQNPAADFAVFPMMIFCDKPGDSPLLWNILSDEDDLDRFLRADSPWSTTGPVWRRSSLDQAGLRWDESARSWQDWEFHICALCAGLRYVREPVPDCYWHSPSAHGSIGKDSLTTMHIVARTRLLKKVVGHLRMTHRLNPARRRTLASQFLRHAFRLQTDPARGRRIWRAGRRLKVVTRLEYFAVLSAEALGRRIARRVHEIIYPVLRRSPQFGRHRLGDSMTPI